MANVAFSGLSALTSLAAGDLLCTTDVSEGSVEQSKKITMATLRDYLMITGSYLRPTFTWKDADEIYVSGAFYDVDGKYSAWASKLTIDIGSPTASTFYYLYLDNSDITSGTAITASEFNFVTTVPAWSESKKGWYSGSDRCIFGLKTDSSSNIPEFFHSGDTVLFADYVEDRATASISTTWTDVTLSIPVFSTAGLVSFLQNSASNDSNKLTYWRTNGQSGTTGHKVGWSRELTGDAHENVNDSIVITDSAQKIEVKASGASQQIGVYTNGWKFPVGM